MGLSNIWRFPAETAAHGGGIYVLIYLICVILVGYPIILSELAFGRSKQQSVYELYKNTGRWKWSGGFAALTCFLIFCFYNIVAGWVIGYIWYFVKGLVANPEGSLYHCSNEEQFKVFFNVSVQQNLVGNLIWTFLMIVFAVFILQAGVSGGIEKCAKILMPLFIVIMLGLIGYSLSLENAMKGVWHYITPDISKFQWKALASALSQSLISLGVGMGALVTYGAYVDKKDNLRKSSIIIGLGDTLVAFCAGLFLFAFLGHYNPDIANAKIEGGTGLAFVTLPLVFITKFSPFVACLLGIVFFLLIFFAAITSSISLLEVPARYVESYFKMERKKALWLVAGLSSLISIICIIADVYYPGDKNLHSVYQDIVIGVIAPLSSLMFSLFIAFKWRVENLWEEAYGKEKGNKFFAAYMNVSIKYICPLVSGFCAILSLYKLIFG